MLTPQLNNTLTTCYLVL